MATHRLGGPDPGGRPARFILYSHDGHGLGHVSRNLKIAGALTAAQPEASVLLVTGSPMADRLVIPRGVDLLRLPAIRKLSNGSYSSRRLPLSGSDIGDLRSAQIAATVESFAPDVLLADKHPAGVRGELRRALSVLAAAGGSAVVGFRDILDDPAVVRREWLRDHALDLIHASFERVLIYGQPDVLDFARVYGLPPAVSRRIFYTGYVAGRSRSGDAADGAPAHPRRRSGKRPVVLASAGGGADGKRLLATFIESAQGATWQGVVVTGPELEAKADAELRGAAASAKVLIRTFVEDLPSWMRFADVAVCMGGYNTLVDVLAYQTPCVCVPRTAPRSEQLIRAEAFARLGLLELVHPSELRPETLRQAIASALVPSSSTRARGSIEFDGASRAAGQLLDLAAKNRGGASAARSKHGAVACDGMTRIACLCADPGVPYGSAKGASVHFGEITRALADEGAAVLALATRVTADAAPPRGVVAEQLPGPGKGSSVAERLEADALRTAWLVKRLERHGAEMLYERLALHTVVGSLAARELGIPHVVELNAPLLEESRRYRRLEEPEAADLLERATLECADLVLAVSRPLADYAVERGAPRVRVMPNAVAAERFPRRGGGPQDEAVAVFAGHLRLWHGVETIAESWLMLGRAAPRLLVIGDGQGLGLLEAVGAEATGPIPHSEVPAQMMRGQIGLAPYGADSPRYFSPLKLFEYLAAGLAVVATDLPGVRDVVGPDRAMLVAPGDTAGFARAVERLAFDRSLRERMGAAGSELVAAGHTWRHRAREVLLAATELAGPGAVARA